MVPQFNNSEDFAIASEKRNTSIQNNHLGLGQRETLWVYLQGTEVVSVFRKGWIQHLVPWDLPSCSSSPSLPCLPASPTAPKVSLVGWYQHSWRKVVLRLAWFSHLPTPGIRGEVNSIINILGERKGKGWLPRVTGGYQNQEKENGHQVIKSIDVLDGGIHFSSNSKSISNVIF